MPTLIKLKRSVTGNPLQPAQLNVEIDEGEPFVDIYSKALVVGGKKNGSTKDKIGDHYISETDEWIDTYQPLYRSGTDAVTIGNEKGRISVGAIDIGNPNKGTKINIKDNLPVDINGVILHSLSSSSGGSPDYGDRYSFIGCSDETPNTAIFSKGTTGNYLGTMSITNATSDFKNFTRLRMFPDHSVLLNTYINGDTPTNPDKSFTISGLNLVQESGYIQVGSSVNATKITNDGISTRKLNDSSILGVGSSSNPVYINSSGQFQPCNVMYRHVVTVSISITGGKSCEFDIAIYNTSSTYYSNLSSLLSVIQYKSGSLLSGAFGDYTGVSNVVYNADVSLGVPGLDIYSTDKSHISVCDGMTQTSISVADSVVSFIGSRI